ncbi:tail fiber protein [Yersinia enterocolitica]|nr:tail fiber protein [Yersinia enterocolitica]
MPDLPPTQSNEAKWFTEGGNGVSPSWPGSTWFNIIQAEMLNVLAAASITPDKENLSQLSEAIQHLITSGVPDLKDASLTQKGIVQLSNATNSNSEILAATPKAVSDLGALLLKISNNLSEIKDAGPAAVAQTLLNLGLGDAAKKGIATNAEMQVGTADKVVSLVGLMSVFGKRTFSENDYIRIPDVPGGLIIQWMKINNFPANAFQTVTLPTAMPHQLLNVVSTMYYGSLSASAEANARVTDFTLTNFRAAAGLSYTTSQTFIAIGY